VILRGARRIAEADDHTALLHVDCFGASRPDHNAQVRSMLTLFGSVAVSIMMLSYTLETRSRWFVLVFAGASAATAAYSALAGVYPITAIEAV
jgi:hypothetical protein